MAIDYRTLIIKQEPVANEEGKKVIINTPHVAKKKSEVEYNIVGISGPDIVVEKKTPRKHEQFVLLMTQGQVYVKDLKTGNIAMGDGDNINNFFTGLEEPLLCVDNEGNKLCWTKFFYRGMKFARCILKLVSLKDLHEWINKGMIYANLADCRDEDLRDYSDGYDFKLISTIKECVPEDYRELFTEVLTQRMIGRYTNALGVGTTRKYDDADKKKIESLIEHFNSKDVSKFILIEKYGISGVRRFIDEYFQTAVSTFPNRSRISALITGSNGYYYNYSHSNLRYETTFDLTRLLEYLFYNSVEQGYANNIDGFIDMWRDTLSMENAIFKQKIVDKYPEYLASYHQILCYKYDLIKQKIDEEQWAERAEEMAKYERHGITYSILAPKTPNDMLDEARQQSNCLSSYVRHVIDGSCMIFFLRKTKDINNSLVTIEVRRDGGLGQVRARFNKSPREEEMEYVRKWHEDKFIKGKINEEEE